MEIFDLEKAKKGAKVETRDGKPVRIVCFDREDTKMHANIVALISNRKGWERVVLYTSLGHVASCFDPSMDLFLKETNGKC